VDLDGHREEPALAACLREMEEMSAFFKILGSFPRAETVEKVS
jgi:chorismate mutase/prephenate dehydratase